jgi:hypothetical protein
MGPDGKPEPGYPGQNNAGTWCGMENQYNNLIEHFCCRIHERITHFTQGKIEPFGGIVTLIISIAGVNRLSNPGR